MKIYLKVPFEQKDQVKTLGALWDYVGKSWYVESRNVDMSKFKNFMHTPPEHLNVPHKETEYERQFRISMVLDPSKKKKPTGNNSCSSKNVAKNSFKHAKRVDRRLKKMRDFNRSKSGECIIIYKKEL